MSAAVQSRPDTARSPGWRTAPWWTWPVLVFVVTRLIDALMIVRAATHQIALYPKISTYQIVEASPASPGYLGVAVNWDAQWFWQIALHGYPHELPWREGMVWRSEWAFAPLYPLASRLLMDTTGLSFAAAGTILTLAFSGAAVVLVFKLVDETAGRFPAQATTLLLCTSMAAPVFQIAYTEGPALFFVALALLLLRRGRYGWTALALLGLGLTRHVLAPFVLVLAVHALLRWRATGRPDRPSLVLLATGIALTALWPVTAAVATGRLTAFTDTQRGWRRSKATGPFGLFSVASELGGPVALAGVAVGLLAVLWLVLRRGGPRWGPELRTWAAAYPTYIALVAPAGISVFRLMLLAFPLMWVLPEYRPTPRSHVATLVILAVVGTWLQWYWIRHFLVIGPLPEQFAMP